MTGIEELGKSEIAFTRRPTQATPRAERHPSWLALGLPQPLELGSPAFVPSWDCPNCRSWRVLGSSAPIIRGLSSKSWQTDPDPSMSPEASTVAADEVRQNIASFADDVFQMRARGRLEEGLASAEEGPSSDH